MKDEKDHINPDDDEKTEVDEIVEDLNDIVLVDDIQVDSKEDKIGDVFYISVNEVRDNSENLLYNLLKNQGWRFKEVGYYEDENSVVLVYLRKSRLLGSEEAEETVEAIRDEKEAEPMDF